MARGGRSLLRSGASLRVGSNHHFSSMSADAIQYANLRSLAPCVNQVVYHSMASRFVPGANRPSIKIGGSR